MATIETANQQLEQWRRDAERRLMRGDAAGARAACLRILEIEPAHADAHFLLGVMALAAGRPGRGCTLIERAIELAAPATAEYYAQYARGLALAKRHREARAAADAALERGAESAHTLDTLGVVFARVGAHEQAERAFAAAVERAPDNAEYRYNHAAALKFLGRFDAAEAAYEAAIEHAPRMHRAHSALAALRRVTPEHNHVERLERLLARIGDDVDGELHLRHALAKEHEDLGRYDLAFEHLTQGREHKRRMLDYSIEQDEALFAEIERRVDAAFVTRAGPGHPSPEPIFVVGMPRTGTTLVDRILSSHSAVSSAGELQSFGIELKRLAGTRSSRVLDLETLAQVRNVDLAELGRRYVESTRPATGHVPHFVDKMPLNFLYVGLIRCALPNAKLVCLRRHPLDTCLSNFRQLFALEFSYYNYAYRLSDVGRYYVLFDRLIAHWRGLFGDALLELRYEDLVADQEAQTRRLLEHCGLPFEPACLAFERNSAPVATASAVQVREPLNAGAVGRWRRYARHLAPLQAELEAAGITIDEL